MEKDLTSVYPPLRYDKCRHFCHICFSFLKKKEKITDTVEGFFFLPICNPIPHFPFLNSLLKLVCLFPIHAVSHLLCMKIYYYFVFYILYNYHNVGIILQLAHLFKLISDLSMFIYVDLVRSF